MQVPQSRIDASALELAQAQSAREATEQQVARQAQALARQAEEVEAAKAAEEAAKARSLDLQVSVCGRVCVCVHLCAIQSESNLKHYQSMHPLQAHVLASLPCTRVFVDMLTVHLSCGCADCPFVNVLTVLLYKSNNLELMRLMSGPLQAHVLAPLLCMQAFVLTVYCFFWWAR